MKYHSNITSGQLFCIEANKHTQFNFHGGLTEKQAIRMKVKLEKDGFECTILPDPNPFAKKAPTGC